MRKYIIKRIGYMFLTLFIITSATFFLMHSIPGDPLAYMAKNLPEQTRENYYAKYGLDKSKGEQYLIFMKNLVTKGDLGESLRYPGRSVSETISVNSKVSAIPGGLALLFGLVIGVGLGIIAALNKNKWPDYLVMVLAIIGITIPVFVMAAVLQYLLTVKFQLLPTFCEYCVTLSNTPLCLDCCVQECQTICEAVVSKPQDRGLDHTADLEWQ